MSFTQLELFAQVVDVCAQLFEVCLLENCALAFHKYPAPSMCENDINPAARISVLSLLP